MAIRSLNQLKAWFKKGMYPTESQFGDWLDSFLHREDKIPVGSVDGLSEAINSKAEQSAVDTLSQNVSAISTKADGAGSVASSALNDAKKALSDVATAQATAQQAIADAAAAITALRNGVAPEGDTLAKLYAKIQTLNATVTSNDVNLDTVQEIVAFIKNNKDVIDSISTSKISITNIVDNLLSSDINRPLSANQGKILKDLLDALATSLSNKVDKVNGKQLSTEDFTAEEKQKLAQQSGVNTGDQDLSGLQPKSQKNQANGYAGLDDAGKVPTALLPSYVDDVMEAANFSNLPSIGESGKIYITTNDNKQYRWSGSAYVNIATSPGTTDAVTEGATNLYFTEGRVRNTLLTGISFLVNQAITTTDSILGALGKLQVQISSLGSSKVDKIGVGQTLPAGVSTLYDILLKVGIESNADLTSLLSNTNSALFNTLPAASKDTLIEIIRWLIDTKQDIRLTKDRLRVGNVDNIAEEVELISPFDPNIPHLGQFKVGPFSVEQNAGTNGTLQYVKVYKSQAISLGTNAITLLENTQMSKELKILDVQLDILGLGGTLGGVQPNVKLCSDAAATTVVSNIPWTYWAGAMPKSFDCPVSVSKINLSNGLYLSVSGGNAPQYNICRLVITGILVQ